MKGERETPYCSKCGALNEEDSKFCLKCGSSMAGASATIGGAAADLGHGAQDFGRRMQEEGERVGERVRREVEARVGTVPPEVTRNEPLLGAIGAGATLLIIALTVLRFRDSPTLLVNWFQQMTNLGVAIRPPEAVLRAGAFFFFLTAAWSIVMAVLRLLVQQSMRKALGDVAGGVFCFFAAFVLGGYAAGQYGGVLAIALFVVGLGVLIIAHGIIAVVLPWPRRTT
jgi:hypothetical protein